MTEAEVIERGREVLKHARKHGAPEVEPSNFLEFARAVADVIKDWPKRKREAPWVRPFVEELRVLEGDFARIVEADPMVLYKPAHEVALAFHESSAKIRYNRSANRTSKSQTGYAEHYFVVTGTHKWRTFLEPPASTFIVGVNFSKYAPNVFERKFISGEPGNMLSPMFPENGKWLHHYNDRKHIITVACVACAERGRPKDCTHHKSTITLYSDLEGPDVLQGAQFNLGHFDEHIKEEFFDEAMERLKTVPHAALIITGTPLLGKSSWEHRRLTRIFNQGPRINVVPGTDIPLVSLHTIDQYQAGLVPKEEIDASRLTMDPLEQEARIYGKPAPLAKHSVFDRFALHEMEDQIKEPIYGDIEGHPTHSEKIEFKELRDGAFRIWEQPEEEAKYVIGCDVAAGLTNRDYSCATVLKIPEIDMVAQLHGWMNPLDYAMQAARLGRHYNWALMVPERTGGLGVGMIHKLKEIGYWNLFRDLTDPSQAEYAQDPVYGVDTNIRSKAHMISCLQSVIKERQIFVPCAETLEELRAFGQEITPQGLNVRLRGEGGTNDDRVMSLAFAVYVYLTYQMDTIEDQKKAQIVYKNTIWKQLHKELDRSSANARDQYFNG